MPRSGRVVVVGSVNVDHVVAGAALPAPGETATGGSYARHPGGKGANQAVAAARWGAAVRMLGAVGEDADGASALDALRAEGIDVDGVRVVEAATGVALIVVDSTGENQIAVASGANDLVAVPAGWSPGEGEGVVLTGFEVPDAAVLDAARAGHAAGWTVVLDPAPARALPAGLPRGVVLTPNAGELATLGRTDADPAEAAAALARRSGGAVVVTLGADGALVCRDGAPTERIAAPDGVEVVDTTGAGDTLTGVLAASLAAGAELVEAARTAVAAASRATTRAGAREGMPRRET